MSGFVMAMGRCIVCNRVFSFNPKTVPSTSQFSAEREPICESCMAVIQSRRQKLGLAPFPVPPDAYEPLPEEEL